MVTIRRAKIGDAASIASVWVEGWKHTYRGIVPDGFLDSIEVDDWEDRQRRILGTPRPGTAAYVAETACGVVGWASSGPNRAATLPFAGELYTLYLLSSSQRQGIGRMLMAAAAGDFIDSSVGSMVLWVLAENWNARRFYETLGGQPVGEQQVSIGGASLREVAYGWDDLSLLAPDGSGASRSG